MFKPLPGGRGLLTLNGVEIKTPNFILATKRGAALHLTPENYPQAPVGAVFTEHFVDHNGFASEAAKTLPLSSQLKLVAPRAPHLEHINRPNTEDLAGLATFQGTQLVSVPELARYMAQLEPDLMVALHDIPNKPGKPGKNRGRKMQLRSEKWFHQFKAAKPERTALLASVAQETVESDYLKEADGLYSVDADLELPAEHLRVCGVPLSLSEIDARIGKFDLFYCDIEALSDRGLAIEDGATINLGDSRYERDMAVLGKTGYAKAYLHHLLNAKEMTAQVILQQHNLAVVDEYFRAKQA